MNKTDKIEESAPNGFISVLQRKELSDGFLTEASEQLGEAALAATRTGKKATVTVVLTLKPRGNALEVGAVVTSKIPSEIQDSLTIFYCDESGGLHRDNPNQKEFNLEVRKGGVSSEPEQKAVAS